MIRIKPNNAIKEVINHKKAVLNRFRLKTVVKKVTADPILGSTKWM